MDKKLKLSFFKPLLIKKDSIISLSFFICEYAFFKSLSDEVKSPPQTTKSEVKFKEAEPVTEISELFF